MYFQWLLLLRYKHGQLFMSEMRWNKYWIKALSTLHVELYLPYLSIMMFSYFLLSWTCSIWAGTLHWLDTCLLYTITDRNIAFLVPLLHVICEVLGELVLNPDYRQKGQSRNNCIILLFNSNSKRRWINLFFCRINTISIQCLKI